MKNILLLVIVLSFKQTLTAQYNQGLQYSILGQNDNYLDENESWIKKINPEGKTLKTIEGNSSKQKKDRNFTSLNEKGRVTEREYTNRWEIGPFKFKSYFHKKFSYKNGMAEKVDYFNEKGELTYSYYYEYLNQYKLKSSQTFKKNKKIAETLNEFNSDSNITEYRSFKIKDGIQKLQIKYQHEYYPDKQRKQTRMYNSKNTLKYTWNYDCNPKGEVQNKNSTQVCKNIGTDNKGRTVEVIFNTDPKGKKTKNIYTYVQYNNKKTPVSSEFYLIEKGKEIKKSELHWPDSLEKFYSYKYYDDKGRLLTETMNEYSIYNHNEKINSISTSKYYYKGKLMNQYVIKCNERGLPLSSEKLDKNGKVINSSKYTYGKDSYTISSFNKKQRLIEEYNGKLSYY